MEKKLKEILSSHKSDRAELIPILQNIQTNLGYIPKKAISEVSKFIGVPESEVYGVATFYAQFRFTPVGKKHIMVCEGTACHVRGSTQIIEGIGRLLGIKEGEATHDLEYSLESVACLGCCALAPCVMIDKKVESKLTLKDLERLFSKTKNEKKR